MKWVFSLWPTNAYATRWEFFWSMKAIYRCYNMMFKCLGACVSYHSGRVAVVYLETGHGFNNGHNRLDGITINHCSVLLALIFWVTIFMDDPENDTMIIFLSTPLNNSQVCCNHSWPLLKWLQRNWWGTKFTECKCIWKFILSSYETLAVWVR